VNHSANNWSTDIIQLDYNNYYTEGPYIVSTYTSLKTWQDDIAQDYHSINEKVNFTHFPQNLHTDGKKAILPSSADLMYDMDYKRRLSYTNAGCYHDFVPHSYDAKVEKVVSPQNGMTTGISTDVSIQIANVGLELDSCEIHWKVNGILQPVYRWSSTPGLAFGEISPSFIIGSFIPIGGENILEIWTARPNAQWDGNPFNDTLVLSVTSCDSALHGRYTVGTPSSDFKNMQQVVDKLSNCSISGPVVFELAAGAYTEIVFRNAIQGASAQNTITFTSARGRASDVMIGTTTEVAVNLRNVGHIHFKNVSIGTTQSQTSYGVKLEGDCENISFYACNIYANASSTSSTSAAIYYSGTNNSPLYLKNISIVKNNIQGGYYNLYLNYAGGSKNNMPASAANRTSVTIDSNYFTDAYTYGISSSYFCYAPSISYNSIIPRTSSTTFYGITLSNYCTVDKIVNNRLNLINNGTTYGMNLSYLNHDTTYGADEPCLIANNEIISNIGTTVYGINRTYGRMYVINNSIYVCGTTTTRALVMGTASTATTNSFYAYNNIVIANGTGSNNQAIYASNANYIRRTYQVFFDYNAYYSTLDMAYAGSALPNLSDWQSTYQQDSNAIYIMPAFVDVTKNLHLADFNPALICLKNDLVDYDINNYQRTTLTIRGAYSTPLYEGFDLALEAFVEPIVGAVECFPDYTPVKISLYNQGTYLADFAQDSVVLHFSCVSDSVNVQNTVVINSDSLLAMNKEVYEVFPMLDIIYPGTYQLKVWMECDRDEQAFNDTLILDYYVEKSILPYDNDFSWTGAGVAVNQVHGTIEWHISDQLPLPAVFGDKSLHFNSVQGKGSISQALFPSVHLQGTYHPRLQFWYAHDNANPTLRDHMDIKISLDGGATFTLLKTIFRYNQAYNTPTWVPYLIDLSNYTQGSCIILSFVAYSYGGGDQLIDRINIVAAQDMKLSLISPDFSEFTACDLSNKAFSVIIENMTNQPIPFHSGDSITLDITGINPQTFTYPLSGKLEGMAIDTIEITQMADFSVSGNYNILAYTNDIDSIQTNDTDRVSYSFLADINLHEIVPIGYKNVGDTVYPTVKIINTGSIAVYSPFELRMILNGKDTIVEPITDMMEVGDTITHLFTNYFIVPEISSVQPFYLLDILSALPCDGLASNNLKKYIGNVNFKDLNIYEINYPTANTYLKKNEEVYVEAYIYNRGTYDSEGVVVYIEVDSGGVLITSFSDTTEAIAAEATILHTFSTPYHVPEFNADSMMYTVRVFLQASDEDVDLSNDTLSVETYALNDVSIDAFGRVNWTMEQNIPNPASAATRIAYSIPQEGIIHFTITTIARQVLHSQDIPSSAGAHSMEFDTQHLAGGIYYYSMEYQGQRIVKKMTVQK